MNDSARAHRRPVRRAVSRRGTLPNGRLKAVISSCLAVLLAATLVPCVPAAAVDTAAGETLMLQVSEASYDAGDEQERDEVSDRGDGGEEASKTPEMPASDGSEKGAPSSERDESQGETAESVAVPNDESGAEEGEETLALTKDDPGVSDELPPGVAPDTDGSDTAASAEHASAAARLPKVAAPAKQREAEVAVAAEEGELRYGDVVSYVSAEGETVLFTYLGAGQVGLGGIQGDVHTVALSAKGTLTIPRSIRYNGAVLAVTSVCDGAFEAYAVGSRKVSHGFSAIVLPATIASIGKRAFDGDAALTSVVLEGAASLTAIGERAFAETSLTEFTVPANVASLGASAFQRSKLETLNMESRGIAKLPDSLMASTQITSLDWVPKWVTALGSNCFAGCTRLTRGDVPGQVTSIGGGLFANCTALSSYTIPAETGLTEIPSSMFSGCIALSDLDVPSFITSIEDSAFYNTGLTELLVPSHVTYLGSQAFANCQKLTSVAFEDDRGLLAVSNGLFRACASLRQVQLPSSVRSIADYAFAECSALTEFTVPADTTSVGDFAFSSCTRLDTLIVAGDGTYLRGTGTSFYGSRNLARVVYWDKKSPSLIFSSSMPAVYYTIAYYASHTDRLEGADPVSRFCVLADATPATATAAQVYSGTFSVAPEEGGGWVYENGYSPLTQLTDSTWAYATAATRQLAVGDTFEAPTSDGIMVTYTVTALPDGLHPGSVMAGVSGLASSATAVPTDTVGSITLSDWVMAPDAQKYTVKSIADYAFFKCSRLASVTVPATVDSIGSWAFGWCTGLRVVTFEGDVSAVRDDGLFAGCASITRVLFMGKKARLSFGASSPRVYYAVRYYESERGVELGNALATLMVKEGARLDSLSSSDFYTDNEHDFSTKIPSLQTGFQWAYEPGFGPTVPLEDSMTVYMEGIGFQVNVNVLSGSVSSTPCWFKVLTFDESSNTGTVQVGSGLKEMRAIHTSIAGMPVIPRSVTDAKGARYTVVAIGDWAFGAPSVYESCQYISGVSLPSTLTHVGESAFDHCPFLTSVALPASVKSMGDRAFAECTALTTVSFPSNSALTVLPRQAFYGDYRLKAVTLPSGLREIGEEAFADMMLIQNRNVVADLTAIELPQGLQTIGRRAFANAASLSAISFPVGIQSVGEKCFEGCFTVASVTFQGDANKASFAADCFAFGAKSAFARMVFMGKKSTTAPGCVSGSSASGDPLSKVMRVYYNVVFYGSSADFSAGKPSGNLVILKDTAAIHTVDGSGRLSGSMPQLQKGYAYTCESGFNVDRPTTDSFYAVAGADLSQAKMTFEKEEYPFSSFHQDITPEPIVTWVDGSRLRKGVDYQLDTSVNGTGYLNNYYGPIAFCYVVGIGDYGGRLGGSFGISFATDASDSFTAELVEGQEFVYNGQPKTPEVSVTAMLVGSPYDAKPGVDYAVSYADNVSAGTGYVLVEAMGRFFSGTYRYPFVIEPLDLSECELEGPGETCRIQAGSEARPGVMLTSPWGDVLQEGVDYTLSYGNNTEAGKARLYVRGIGNYAGALYRSFIVEVEASDSSFGEGGGEGVGEGDGAGVGTGNGPGLGSGAHFGDGQGLGMGQGDGDTTTVKGSVAPGARNPATLSVESHAAGEEAAAQQEASASAGGGGASDSSSEQVRHVYKMSDEPVPLVALVLENPLPASLMTLLLGGIIALGALYRKGKFSFDRRKVPRASWR